MWHDNIQQIRPTSIQHLLNCRHQITHLCHTSSRNIASLRKLQHVRENFILFRRITQIRRFSTRIVANSCTFIIKLPSPSMSTTTEPGLATAAPIAAGNPNPMAPNPLEYQIQTLEGQFNISTNGDVWLLVLSNLGRIDIDMDNLCSAGKCFQLSRYTIIKPDSKSQQQITLVHSIVSIHSPMHTQHMQ
ncbi:centrosomal protein of 41 kDa, partial [Striga asiatica]